MPTTRKALLAAALSLLAWSSVSARAQQNAAEQRARTPLDDVPMPALPDVASSLPTAYIAAQDEAWREVDELLESGDLDAAQRRFSAAAVAAGDAPHWRRSYVDARLRAYQGQFVQARRLAQEADQLQPGQIEVDYLLGLLLWSDGRQPEGMARLARVTRSTRHDHALVTAAWHHLGRALASEGYWLAAAEAFGRFDRAIWETCPEHRIANDVRRILRGAPRGAFELRLDALRQAGAHDEAADVARRAVERFPDDPIVARELVRALLDAGRADDAYATCRAREAAEGGEAAQPSALLLLRAAHAAGRLNDALQAVLGDPAAHRAAALRITRQLESIGANDAALQLAQALCAALPDDGDAGWALARAAAQAGKFRESLDALTARMVPEMLADRFTARVTEWRELRLAAAALPGFIGDQRRVSTDDPRRTLALGFLALGAGRWELAAALFDAVEAEPLRGVALIAAGHAALARYDFAAARLCADEALKLDPESSAALFLRGAALDGLDENEAAQALLRRAARREPADAAILCGLARHLQRQPDGQSGAQRYFQDALEVDPLNGDVFESLIDSYLDSQKVDVARSRIEKTPLDELPDDVARRVTTALRFSSGPADEFVAELERQARAEPSDWRTTMKLAAAYLYGERWADADRTMERVLALGIDDEQTLYSAAIVKQAMLDFGAAATLVSRLVERYPNRRYVLAAMAELQLCDFRVPEARATLRRLLESSKTDSERVAARARLLQSYTDFGDFDEALADFAGEPEALTTVERLGLLAGAERYDDAIRLALEALELAGEPHEALERLAGLCLIARQPRVAEERIRARLREHPDDAAAIELLIQVLAADRRGGEALEAVQALPVQGISESILQRELLAAAHRAAGDWERAIRELDALLGERMVQMQPVRVARVRNAALSTLVESRQFDAALERIQSWHEADSLRQPSRRLLLERQRAVYQAADRMDDYIRVSREILEMNPRDDGVCNDLGYTLVDRGEDLGSATEMIRRAVRSQPLNAAYLDSLGWACYKAGDFAGAEKWLSRAARLHAGNDAVVNDHLGDAAFRLGDSAAAKRAWQRAVELADRQPPGPARDRDAGVAQAAQQKIAALQSGARPSVAPTAQEDR